jgi:hypothetical protein
MQVYKPRGLVVHSLGLVILLQGLDFKKHDIYAPPPEQNNALLGVYVNPMFTPNKYNT